MEGVPGGLTRVHQVRVGRDPSAVLPRDLAAMSDEEVRAAYLDAAKTLNWERELLG